MKKFYSLLNLPVFLPEFNSGKNNTEQEYISAKSMITSMIIPPQNLKDSFGFFTRQDLEDEAKARESEIPANEIVGMSLAEQDVFIKSKVAEINALLSQKPEQAVKSESVEKVLEEKKD